MGGAYTKHHVVSLAGEIDLPVAMVAWSIFKSEVARVKGADDAVRKEWQQLNTSGASTK